MHHISSKTTKTIKQRQQISVYDWYALLSRSGEKHSLQKNHDLLH